MSPRESAAAPAEQFLIDIPDAARDPESLTIARALIHPDPQQPRLEVDADLRANMAKEGQLQDITVRPHPDRPGEWMLVDGERRWRSSEGVLTHLRAKVRADLGADRTRRLRTQLSANLSKQLTPFEQAKAFKEILEANPELTFAQLSEETGVPRSTISERVALLELGPWVDLVASGQLPLSHAVRVLLPLRSVPDEYHEKAIELAKKDYRWAHKGGIGGVSIGDFERLINSAYRPYLYPLTKTKSYGKQPAKSPRALVAATGTCVICACTQDKACEGGCSWLAIDKQRALGVCSSCTTSPKQAGELLRKHVEKLEAAFADEPADPEDDDFEDDETADLFKEEEELAEA